MNGIDFLSAFGLGKLAQMHGVGKSEYGGIPVGAITFSYWHMPVGYLSTLKYMGDAHLTSTELMGYDLEVDSGAPVWKLPWDQTGDEQAERAEWRRSIEPDKVFAETAAKYASKGIGIHILKPELNLTGDEKQSDEELDFWFKAAKAVGAKCMTREMPNPSNYLHEEKGLRRIAKFCEKYDMLLAFHNHTQITPDFYDGPLLEWSDRFRINFDIGHYVAANDDNPLDFVRKYHDKIFSIHLKDRTRKSKKARTTPFGEGDVDFAGLFSLLQKEKWYFNCDIEMEYIIPVGSDAVKEVNRCRRYCRSVID